VYHQLRIGLTKRFVAHAVHADASVLGKQLIQELVPCRKVSRTHALASRTGQRPGCLGRPFPQTGGLPIPIASRRTLRRRKRKAVVPRSVAAITS
jgi:hypothetical protein